LGGNIELTVEPEPHLEQSGDGEPMTEVCMPRCEERRLE